MTPLKKKKIWFKWIKVLHIYNVELGEHGYQI